MDKGKHAVVNPGNRLAQPEMSRFGELTVSLHEALRH